MTDMMSGLEKAKDSKSKAGLDGLDDQLVERLVSRAKAGGMKLTGEDGVLPTYLRVARELGGTRDDRRVRRTTSTLRTQPPRI